jgi:hypothetical protein
MKWVHTVTSSLLREIMNSENKKMTTTQSMQRKTTVVNSQHYNIPLETNEITKYGQICITALKRASSHG